MGNIADNEGRSRGETLERLKTGKPERKGKMSLDISLMVTKPTEVYEANITHNLGKMASEAGVYEACWRPEEIGAGKAKDIIPILEKGIALMESDQEGFESFAPGNGWGTYGNLLGFLRNYLEACKENPEAEIRVSR